MKRGKKAGAPDAPTIIAAIRAAVKELPEGKPLTRKHFFATTKFDEQDIFRHFARWTDAIAAAGFNFRHWNSPVTNDELLADWGRLVRELRGLPTNHDYRVRGNHASSSVIRRFGGWGKVPDAFRTFAGEAKEWRDVVALLPPKGTYQKPKPGRRPIYVPVALKGPVAPEATVAIQAPATKVVANTRRKGRRPARLPGRPICGPPLDYACLRHAPANEAGVLVLFGAMARDLGFLIDSLQAEFPDCEAKRLIAPDTWQTVSIEFEFQSRNFLTHGHDPAKCDLIVCWEHNWPECPDTLGVIALGEELKRATASV